MKLSVKTSLSIFVRHEPTWVKGIVACVDPAKADSVLKSACQVASRSLGETEVRALHVPRSKNWRSDSSISELLKKACAFAPTDVVEGSSSVKKVLVNELNNQHPDLCVIGSHSGVNSIFSTVQYVLKYATCDVLVVRDDGLSSTDPMKAIVCFGINDWEGSIDAFKATIRMARPGDHIEAVHVVYAGGPVDAVFGPPMVVPRGNGTTGDKIEKALEQAMIEVLDDASTSLNRDDVVIKPTV
jgi:hypothetical protein